MNKIAMTLIFGFALNALAVEKRKFDFVVGVDGDFKAAVAAAAAANPSESRRFVIFFPEGEYDLTNLTADRHGKTTFSTSYVSLIGETRDKAV
ncbi:MAG: pectin esterase, partial [Fibrobacter sp.]|nr:pectin esterase [Fibrobacter sp.]